MGRGLAGGVLAVAAFLVARVVVLRPPQPGPDEATIPIVQDPPPDTDEPQRTCLADVIYFEARGRSEAAKHAVAHVVLNRVADPRFPKEICAVVRQRNP